MSTFYPDESIWLIEIFLLYANSKLEFRIMLIEKVEQRTHSECDIVAHTIFQVQGRSQHKYDTRITMNIVTYFPLFLLLKISEQLQVKERFKNIDMTTLNCTLLMPQRGVSNFF